MNKLLLVVGAIFLICVIVGYVRGFLKIVVSLVASILSFALVIAAVPYVSSFLLEHTPMKESIQNKCVEMMIGEANEAEKDEIANTQIDKDQQIQMVENSSFPEALKNKLLENNNQEVYDALGVTSFADYTGAYIAKMVTDIIAFLLAFLVIRILIRLALMAVDIIEKLPIVGKVNRLAGAATGLVSGLLWVWVLFAVITMMYSTALGASCMEDIANNEILTRLYDTNLLMKYVIKF